MKTLVLIDVQNDFLPGGALGLLQLRQYFAVHALHFQPRADIAAMCLGQGGVELLLAGPAPTAAAPSAGAPARGNKWPRIWRPSTTTS